MPPDSRLVSRAPRRSRCSPCFIHGLLSPLPKGIPSEATRRRSESTPWRGAGSPPGRLPGCRAEDPETAVHPALVLLGLEFASGAGGDPERIVAVQQQSPSPAVSVTVGASSSRNRIGSCRAVIPEWARHTKRTGPSPPGSAFNSTRACSGRLVPVLAHPRPNNARTAAPPHRSPLGSLVATEEHPTSTVAGRGGRGGPPGRRLLHFRRA